MNEKQVKELCKFLIDNGNNQFTDGQKELIKHAVDQARTPQQLVEIIITSRVLVGEFKKKE